MRLVELSQGVPYAGAVESNSRAIIQLAWARVLGLPDDVLVSDSQERVHQPDASMIMSVVLFGRRIVRGPAWFLDRAGGMSDDELDDEATLISLASGFVGRSLGTTVLAYTDRYVPVTERSALPVSDDPRAAADLERQCPPDEVTDAGLSEAHTTLVLLDELDTPLAGAGLTEWQGIIGQLTVLTGPTHRRQGYGRAAAALGVNEALDRGLVAQWRAQPDNLASFQLGRRLGFVTVGRQTTVVFG